MEIFGNPLKTRVTRNRVTRIRVTRGPGPPVASVVAKKLSKFEILVKNLKKFL